MENSKNSSLSKLIPVMLCFFAMGFVDLVGIASNYVKADLGLSDLHWYSSGSSSSPYPQVC